MNPRGEILPEERSDRWMILLALLVVCISGYFLFFYQYGLGVLGDVTAIGVMQTDGNIRIRHAKSLRWGLGRDQTTIYLKDTVYTPKDTSAEFQWSGKRFILEPESLVQFDESSLDKLEITLLEGKIRTDPSTASKLNISKVTKPSLLTFQKQELFFLPDINPLIIKHSELSSRTEESLAKKLDLDPMRTVMIPKLYLNQLADYQIVMTAPTDNLFRFVGHSWIKFKWEPLPLKNVEYQVHISGYSNFKFFAQSRTVVSSSTILFEQPGNYWWRVVAKWRRDQVMTDGNELVLDKEKGKEIPIRIISSQKQPSKPDTRTVKSKESSGIEFRIKSGAVPREQIAPKGQKSPFDVLFGK